MAAGRGAARLVTVLVLLGLAGCPSPSKPPAPEPPAAPVVIPHPDERGMEPAVRLALSDAEDAVRRQSGSPQAWGRYGALLDAHQLVEQAETCYRRAAELAPADFRWSYLRAIALEKLSHDPREIRRLLTTAAQLQPSYPPVHVRLGGVLFAQGRLEEALDAYERAIELDATLAIAHRGAGQVRLRLGQVQQAAGHLERAEALMPGDRAVATALARAYALLGRDAEAQAAAARSRDLGDVLSLPDPVRYEVQSMVVGSQDLRAAAENARARGDLRAAGEALRRLVERVPDDAHARLQLATTERRLGRADEARAQYTAALRLDERLADAHFGLGLLDLGAGDAPGAIEHLRRGLALDPDHAAGHARLASALAQTGALDEALPHFQRAAELAPGDAATLVNWGTALLQQGDAAAAAQRYRQALAAAPGSAPAHYFLGVALEQLGDIAAAAAEYRRALEIDPNLAPARQRLGGLSTGAG